MAGEWRDTSLGEVVRLQRGHDLPAKARVAGSVPVVGSFGITGWHDRARANGPGVTVGRSGASIGVVSFVDDNYWPLNTCLYVTDFQGNDPRFCYYWLSTLPLAAYNSGSAQPSLNRNFIYGIPVRVPEVGEQRAIANVLGALDGKIDLNQRRNESLAGIAQAIFKSWFVDFEPVRAKIEGDSSYPMENQTAALFSDRFIDSTLGKIPEGWSVQRIGDVLDLAYGKALKESLRRPGNIRVMGSNGQIGWHDKALVRGPGIVVGRKGNPGVVTWVEVDFFPIDTTFFVVPKHSSLGLRFLFHSLARQDFQQIAADSAVPGLNRKIAYGLPLVLPPSELIYQFEKTVTPLFRLAQTNSEESRTIESLRDSLLPKLLSGEIRIRHAEKIVEGTL
jgi:type I restriction enzyme S subunit